MQLDLEDSDIPEPHTVLLEEVVDQGWVEADEEQETSNTQVRIRAFRPSVQEVKSGYKRICVLSLGG